MKFLIVFVFLIVCATQTNHMRIDENLNDNTDNFQILSINSEKQLYDINEPKSRAKRGVFWDFFQKMVITKNLIVDQYTDTRNTFDEVYNLINDQFSDPAQEKPRHPSSTTESSKFSSEETTDSSEMTTTTEPYRISRYELGRILGRNFRGLQRLQELEFQDALNQSHYNIQEYKAEANKQFANSLAVEKKNQLKALKG
ncbi:uncharacterized protein LOC111683189 [Lucilia cuprina]|uniref:uncharacterized protein LOC111683189 n=1 Tax=Lucilia cuprina TaxID=7375 RepID=UPI001F06B3F2|nr:uncharacterized protein LOC111683189 [Lucilia cuprina]